MRRLTSRVPARSARARIPQPAGDSRSANSTCGSVGPWSLSRNPKLREIHRDARRTGRWLSANPVCVPVCTVRRFRSSDSARRRSPSPDGANVLDESSCTVASGKSKWLGAEPMAAAFLVSPTKRSACPGWQRERAPDLRIGRCYGVGRLVSALTQHNRNSRPSVHDLSVVFGRESRAEVLGGAASAAGGEHGGGHA